MKLWHDDIQRPPDSSWTWARTNEIAMAFLSTKDIEEASLDHDLGLHDFDPDQPDADLSVSPNAHLQPDGYDLVTWMVAAGVVPPKVTIHSWNPVGAKRMASALLDAGCSEVVVAPFDPAVRGTA